MRISDWSSDVCSSDLLAGVHVLALLPVGQRGLGVAQGVLADAILLAQLLEPRLRIGDGFLQHLQRSEEHTSELQSLMRISYAVFCLKKKTTTAQIVRRLLTTKQINTLFKDQHMHNKNNIT